MLSDAEIIRRLRIIRHSSVTERNARRAPSINGIATAAGISREYLFRLLNGEPLGKPAREKLSRVLTSEDIDRARAGVRSTEDLPAVSKSSHFS